MEIVDVAGKNFSDFEARFRRRDLLAALLNSRDYSCNDSLLRTLLRELGYLVSGDSLRADLKWLEEHKLVRLRAIGELTIATLIERGRDIAEGAEVIDGVERPALERD
jgi:hypothetical protein